MRKMFRLFKKTNPEKIRKAQYGSFSNLHDLAEASGYKEKIQEILNLENSELISFIYTKRIKLEETELEVFFLDYRRPSRQKLVDDKMASVCLLSSWGNMDYASLKISRKLPRILESLGASAIGGEVIKFDDDEFDNKVTVYARNANEAKALNKETRELILKSLYDRNLSPELRIGTNFMLFEAEGSKDSPTELVELEKLMADLLSLYVYFANSNDNTSLGDMDDQSV